MSWSPSFLQRSMCCDCMNPQIFNILSVFQSFAVIILLVLKSYILWPMGSYTWFLSLLGMILWSLITSLLVGMTTCSRLIPDPESAISPRSSVPSSEMVFRKHSPGAKGAHCYELVEASRPFQLTELKNNCFKPKIHMYSY